MNFIKIFLLLIGQYFTEDTYLLTAKTQAILWSIADTALIFIFLKIINFVRLKVNKKKVIAGYILLWISILFILFTPFTRTFEEFSILEVIICSIQFSILIPALILTRSDFLLFLKKLMKKSDFESSLLT